MVAITEQAIWVEQIRQIEANDPVQGGENGIDNIPHQQLANRTVFLKSEIDRAKGQIPEGETVSLASLLQMIKELQDKPAPTITQYMIPVGGLFETTKAYATAADVAKDMGYGTWEEYGEGRVTIAKSSKYAIGQTGGEEEVTLTEAQMPKHTHKIADTIGIDGQGGGWDLNNNSTNFVKSKGLEETGGDQPHNNMQPYIVVGRWVRTA